MVPKLHAKGRSFRGAALYLLHDKDRARTSERVAWTETRNLATDNPHMAWRVMAATAMDAGRLKQHAGVKNSGRKSNDCVLHLTLSWHPTEKAGLTREEMIRAASGAVVALRAEARQVLMVCHHDEPHPHVHVLINRVSPDDGRMLSSSKEKLALSAWAQKYEQDRGAVLCEERVANNAAREQGEYVRSEPDKPRKMFEREQAEGNDPAVQEIRCQQQAKDAALAQQQRDQKAWQQKEWKELLERHAAACRALDQNRRDEYERMQKRVQAQFQPERDTLKQRHDAQARAFASNEESVLGRARNAWRALDLRGLFHAETRQKSIRHMGEALKSQHGRQDALRRQQERESQNLQRRQNEVERKQAGELQACHKTQVTQERDRFMAERRTLIASHQRKAVEQKQAWQVRHEERKQAINHARTVQQSRAQEVERMRELFRQRRAQSLDRHHRLEW
jgi:hypothetical protein